MMLKSKHTNTIIVLILALFPLKGCIEEFTPGTLSFEDVLVVEATITNEFKQQKVLLSRTFRFEEGFRPEVNATVTIRTENEVFSFDESSLGEYLSREAFQAEPDKDYTLSIITSEGKEYVSKKVKLTQNTSVIENTYARRELDTESFEGIGIYVDSFDPENKSNYYAYEYEETYQIIAPSWTPDEIVVVSEEPLDLIIATRSQEERVCYKTNYSSGRLLNTTRQFSEDRISEFLVKFIPLDDISLSNRYSLLIKQFTQSQESFEFTRLLNEFSSVENLLSQIQTGFVSGNISSLDSEQVFGFFEVSAVVENRIFFSRNEFIETPFEWVCEIIEYTPRQVVSRVLNNRVKLIAESVNENNQTIYEVVPRICGDCTRLGSNIEPDFWQN